MKKISDNQTSGFFFALSLAAAGVTGLVSATPAAVPSSSEELVEFIQTDIQADQAMKGSKLHVSVKDHIVIIEGTAITLDQSERASARALASATVRAVVNAIEIVPAPDSSVSLKEKAETALAKQDLLDASNVKVTEENGRVTLIGNVGTWDDQELAREVVSNVPAVRAIDNKLVVTFEGVRTDKQIEAQVKHLIADDPLYTGLDFGVQVRDGVVSLNGQVGNKAELDRLVRRSYVTGVVDVSIVNVDTNSDMAMEGMTDKNLTPAEMIVTLKEALSLDPRVDASNVQARVDEGVLTLTGTVRDQREKDAVESTSRGIPGIIGISNQLGIHDHREVANN